MIWAIILAGVVAGLIGSIPNGFLVAKSRGIDIRQHGSGNIGATNVLRVVGKKWGILVFILDAVKGLIAVGLADAISAAFGLSGIAASVAGIVAAMFCILGHNFTPWLGFKGGKGIATSAGVLIGLMPLACLMISTVWVIVFYTTRYVSLASVSASLALPVSALILYWVGWLQGWPLVAFAFLACALAVWRHKSNIERLMKGTEPRFEGKKKKEGA